MTNKSFLHNPRYYTTSHRTWSEATRDADYACAIHRFADDDNVSSGIIAALIICAAALALVAYFTL